MRESPSWCAWWKGKTGMIATATDTFYFLYSLAVGFSFIHSLVASLCTFYIHIYLHPYVLLITPPSSPSPRAVPPVLCKMSALYTCGCHPSPHPNLYMLIGMIAISYYCAFSSSSHPPAPYVLLLHMYIATLLIPWLFRTGSNWSINLSTWLSLSTVQCLPPFFFFLSFLASPVAFTSSYDALRHELSW